MDGEVSRQIQADWAASHSIWRVKMWSVLADCRQSMICGGSPTS